MSQKLFSRNPDLQRLRDDGLSVRIIDEKFLVVAVPYVKEGRAVAWGHLISPLELAGDETRKPLPDHQVFFDGDNPCDADGVKIAMGGSVMNPPQDRAGFMVKFHFSRKPPEGYADYFQKMLTYYGLLAGPAKAVDPSIETRPLQQTPDDDAESVFVYPDTASGRTGTAALADLLKNEVVTILGVGGTGGYIMDKVVKTPAREVRIMDGDHFLNHNAFRAPGAASIEQLRQVLFKVDYFRDMYSRMHRNIKAIPEHVTAGNLHYLDGTTFAFISMDDGKDKEAVFGKLEAIGASFIDVGMGLELNEAGLGGHVRVTLSTPGNRAEARKRATFSARGGDDVYKSNIQIAELNSMNADFAVFRWKKYRGFYRDLVKEMHSIFTTDRNSLANSGE